MKLNMASMSEQEVEQAVAERCSSYGTVKKLKIYLPRRDTVARPFALVDMTTRDEAAELASAMGRLFGIGNAVVVFLQQEHDRVAALARTQYWLNYSAAVPPSNID